MKYRIILIFVILLLGIIFGFLKYLLHPETIGLCQNNGLCNSFWSLGVAWPLHESLLYLIISIIPLIFLPFSFLKIWLKIMVPYFLIVLIFIIRTPDLCSGFLCWDRTLVASGFAKLFLILTVLIIIIQSIYFFIISKRNKKIKS